MCASFVFDERSGIAGAAGVAPLNGDGLAGVDGADQGVRADFKPRPSSLRSSQAPFPPIPPDGLARRRAALAGRAVSALVGFPLS